MKFKDNIVTYHLAMEDREKLLGQVEKYLANREEILFAYAHGSFIEDTFFRDMDIAVFLNSDDASQVLYYYEIAIEDALEKLLGARFPVDVRMLNSAPISFQYRAICGRLLLDRDPKTRIDFFSRLVSRYLDIKPILLYHTKEAFSNEA